MVKSIALVVVSICVGWVFRGIYADETTDSSNQKREELSDVECEDISHEVIEKTIEKEIIKYVPKTKIVYRENKQEDNVTKDPFFIALEQKKFYKAMEYYEEAEEEKHPTYKNALLGYFRKEELSVPWKTVHQIRYFLNMETENEKFVFLLSGIFVRLGVYSMALDLLVDFSYVASFENIKLIHTKIKSISLTYIDELMVAQEYKELVTFLLNRINIGVLSEFYSFELAKVYIKLKKYIKAKELLEELIYNDIYKERAIKLLDYIDEKLAELAEYPIQIPLMRSGRHFLVKAYVNQREVVLLLDTGASITTIDDTIVNGLDIFKKDVTFGTANGEILSNIYSADNFTIGEITISNFHISGGLPVDNSIDGLLGMNFLGRYKFKIDQKEAILFLGNKY